jgi:hypothetical protein
MPLGNMRDLGVRNLIASCLSDACRHTALMDVSNYPAETECPVVRQPGGVRQVWQQARRRAAELEGAAEPDWKDVPLTLACRYPQASRRASRYD